MICSSDSDEDGHDRTACHCFVSDSWSFAGGCRPSASHDTNRMWRLPEIVLLATVPDPVPETEHAAEPRTPPARDVNVSENWLPASEALRIPEIVISVTAGDVNSVAGPETPLASCVAVQVTRDALPPPELDPTVPDHVRSR